jgi:UDP-glucuronate 4-epimerase
LGRKASLERLPPRPEDVPETHADITALETATGFRPRTDLKKGLERFVEWYKKYSKA